MIVAMIWRAVSTDVQVLERKGRPARCLAGRQRGAVRPMLGTTAQLSRGAADSGVRENARAVVAWRDGLDESFGLLSQRAVHVHKKHTTSRTNDAFKAAAFW